MTDTVGGAAGRRYHGAMLGMHVPDAELIRAGIAEAGVEQAHGRVRAINRTAADPGSSVFLILTIRRFPA